MKALDYLLSDGRGGWTLWPRYPRWDIEQTAMFGLFIARSSFPPSIRVHVHKQGMLYDPTL